MAFQNRAADSNSIIDVFGRIPLRPFYGVAALGLVIGVLLEPGDWRLMAIACTALCYNVATALLVLRTWPTAIAVLGVGLSYVQQAIALVGICVAGLLGHFDEIGTYRAMIGNEIWVLLLMGTVSTATLLVLGARQLFSGPPQTVSAARSFDTVAQDGTLEIVLIAAAVFTLMFWAGGELGVGLIKAVFQTLQRAFMFVPFLAGFYIRVSRRAAIFWIITVLANLALGIVTGSRGPAFMPIILFSVGLVLGATAKQRWLVIGLLIVLAVPGAYIFGMIESIRTSVGRLQISEITVDKIADVTTQLKTGKEAAADPYERLPTWARANYRMLTWPTVVVAAATGGEGPYRGFDDLPAQLMASLNVVSLTGEIGSYYNEGLYNLRAADYGFTVDAGTSVEFGFLAEAWDRGGPVAALVYALVALTVFALTEAGVRYFMADKPALRTVAVSVIFTTAFWTLNIYNLPLSLRQMPINLIICYVVFGVVSLFAPAQVFRRKRPVNFRRRINLTGGQARTIADPDPAEIP